MSDVAVRVRDCECPGTPHEEGDVVYVAPTLSLSGGLAAEHDTSTALAETLANAGKPPEGGWNDDNSETLALDMGERMRQKLLVTYVRYGAVGWNFQDERGPIPFDVEAILADYGIARTIAEKGDELYGETVARPLLDRLSKRSQSGQTARSTSVNGSTRKQQRRSSHATTAATKRLSA